MYCQRCGGLIITQYEVFDPAHQVCSLCGREPGVELVSRMRDGEYDLGRFGDYMRCPKCDRKTRKGARDCLCGASLIRSEAASEGMPSIEE